MSQRRARPLRRPRVPRRVSTPTSASTWRAAARRAAAGPPASDRPRLVASEAFSAHAPRPRGRMPVSRVAAPPRHARVADACGGGARSVEAKARAPRRSRPFSPPPSRLPAGYDPGDDRASGGRSRAPRRDFTGRGGRRACAVGSSTLQPRASNRGGTASPSAVAGGEDGPQVAIFAGGGARNERTQDPRTGCAGWRRQRTRARRAPRPTRRRRRRCPSSPGARRGESPPTRCRAARGARASSHSSDAAATGVRRSGRGGRCSAAAETIGVRQH